MTDEHAALIDSLLGPDGPEVSCEECFEQLDRYVEATLADRAPDRTVPGMRAHLAGCPACREDFDSLIAFVGGTGDGGDLGSEPDRAA
jgi:hypothetical protein